jgi:RNA polymerase sigma factor (sigma-70 family)
MEKVEMNLIYRIAWNFQKTTGLDIEELIGEAGLAYTKAMRSFNPDKGTKFTTYAYWVISNELKTYIGRKRSEVGFGQHEIEEPVDENTLTEKVEFLDLINHLKPKAKEICEMILENPEMFTTTTREGMRMKIINHLRSLGWKWFDIRRAFGQIRWALQN